jgi:serine phosphatase RsbU (regulator of sigma subunit)
VGLREAGPSLVLTYVLNLLLDACTRIESLDKRQRILTEATSAARKLERHSLEAETLRLKGELLLTGDTGVFEAAQCFHEAIEVARQQSGKSWELRATMSLARLLEKQGCREEARTMLAEIYGWFTEGFETADLKDAKALLDRLNSES